MSFLQVPQQKSVEDWLGLTAPSEDFSDFANLEYDPNAASSGWTSTGGGYTGGTIVGPVPSNLGGDYLNADFGGWTSTGGGYTGGTANVDSTVWGGSSTQESSDGWLSGWGGALSDIGTGISSFLGGLGFGGTSTTPTNTTQTPQQTTTPSTSGGGTIPSGGFQQTSGQGTQTPTTTEEKPKFISTEVGSNWLMNKLVIMGKFKIPYWFIIVMIGVIYWKRKQIMAVFKRGKK